MLRIAVAYVLIATTVVVYLVVVSKDGTINLKSSLNKHDIVRAKPPVRASWKMSGPLSAPTEINGERRLVRTMW
jgi:hypothetical protein